ncbi:MAG: ABC transporter transmembrane domain-containing protein [Gammaproteobacteria bacterium]
MTRAPESAARQRSRLRPLRGLLPFLLPYRRVIVAALAALCAAAVCLLGMPVAVRHVIDAGIAAPGRGTVDRYFLLLFGLASLTACFASLRFYLVSWIGERVVADLRSTVFRHLLKLSPSFFEITRSGEILSRLTTDTTLIQTVVGSSLSIALRSGLTLVGGLVMLCVTSPRLTALIVLLVPAVIGPILAIGRRVRRLSRDSQDRVADTSALAGEVLNAMPLVQAFTLESLHGDRYETSVEQSFAAARRRIRQRAGLTAWAIVSIFGGLIGVVWMGANDVAAGTMSSGELGQFLLYAVFVGGSTAGLSEIWGSLQQAAGATERLVELLATQPDEAPPANPVTLPARLDGALAFEAVRFCYPSRPERAALDDFSLAIRPGETVALVGPSGAGKSTVLKLALAFYRPQAGRVTLDGIDLADALAGDVRSHIAIVPQETVLFATTIAENIRYGRPGASDEEVRAAAAAAAAADFIETLPEGYDTQVGERGVRLSGGQQQRIAIARAVLKRPAILLLDEATSALDAESERLVQHALDELMQTCTTLVIAHRLATVRRADRIVVMEDGRIIASGTHDELAAAGGLYARLSALQFESPPAVVVSTG